jgi:hypothetical protein
MPPAHIYKFDAAMVRRRNGEERRDVCVEERGGGVCTVCVEGGEERRGE